MQVMRSFVYTGNLLWVIRAKRDVKGKAESGWRSPTSVARRIALVILVLAGICFVVLYDVPSIDVLRQWADNSGWWFPLAYFGLYIGLTQFPIPRTVLTLGAGILFGGTLGIAIAVLATTVSGALSLLIVRFLARDWVRPYLRNKRVLAIDYRLEQRGWLAVLSLRLIAGVPFSFLNYVCALSSIRFWPFVIATAVGSAPNTIAVVLLGDALLEGGDMRMVLVTIALFILGVIGLIVDARTPVVPHARSNSRDYDSARNYEADKL